MHLKVNFTKCQSILAQCFKAIRKRCVFSIDLNVVNVPTSLMVSGRLFHNDGPATESVSVYIQHNSPYQSRFSNFPLMFATPALAFRPTLLCTDPLTFSFPTFTLRFPSQKCQNPKTAPCCFLPLSSRMSRRLSNLYVTSPLVFKHDTASISPSRSII